MAKKYTSLDGLAASLGLPRIYLRELAEARKIPALNIHGRWRFDESQVRLSLNELAIADVTAMTDEGCLR